MRTGRTRSLVAGQGVWHIGQLDIFSRACSDLLMQVWPAIDLRGGRCVRLQQGDYQRETVFADDPVAMARHWVDQGAEFLHLVDLDGAREGQLVNFASVQQILDAVSVPCQLGGGIRDQAALEKAFQAGASRVVIGTQAVHQPEWLAQMAQRFPGCVVLGIDARQGRVATRGWLETESAEAVQLAAQFDELPLAALIYTDISTDGMLSGPNLPAIQAMKRATRLPVVASGGIRSAQDVRQLAAAGLDGCIIGRALYEGRLALPDALRAAREVVRG
jgi:phosphoribosylformimino-5-aminoimidazole carboxamide ribotide isomerase